MSKQIFISSEFYTGFAGFTLSVPVNGKTDLIGALAAEGYIIKNDVVGNKSGCDCAISYDQAKVEKMYISFYLWTIVTNDIFAAINSGGGVPNFDFAQQIIAFFVPVGLIKTDSTSFTNSIFINNFSNTNRNPSIKTLFTPLQPPVSLNNVSGFYQNNILDGANTISVGPFPSFMTGNTGTCAVSYVSGYLLQQNIGSINSDYMFSLSPSYSMPSGVDYYMSFNMIFDYTKNSVGTIIQTPMGIFTGEPIGSGKSLDENGYLIKKPY